MCNKCAGASGSLRVRVWGAHVASSHGAVGRAQGRTAIEYSHCVSTRGRASDLPTRVVSHWTVTGDYRWFLVDARPCCPTAFRHRLPFEHPAVLCPVACSDKCFSLAKRLLEYNAGRYCLGLLMEKTLHHQNDCAAFLRCLSGSCWWQQIVMSQPPRPPRSMLRKVGRGRVQTKQKINLR